MLALLFQWQLWKNFESLSILIFIQLVCVPMDVQRLVLRDKAEEQFKCCLFTRFSNSVIVTHMLLETWPSLCIEQKGFLSLVAFVHAVTINGNWTFQASKRTEDRKHIIKVILVRSRLKCIFVIHGNTMTGSLSELNLEIISIRFLNEPFRPV